MPEQEFGNASSITTFDDGSRLVVDDKGRIKGENPTVDVTVKSLRGQASNPDLRVKLKVPSFYRGSATKQTQNSFQGIIFPYTPQISYDTRADYTSQTPIHTNFGQHYYQRSLLSGINLVAKFTVQNEKDAEEYLASVNLLRSLTKMLSGDDDLAGSPPPVCRLMGYGPFVLDNFPVVVQSMRLEYPEGVDYFTLGKLKQHPVFGTVSVPIVSSVSLNLLPVYSRREMQQFSVKNVIKSSSDSDFIKKGFR